MNAVSVSLSVQQLDERDVRCLNVRCFSFSPALGFWYFRWGNVSLHLTISPFIQLLGESFSLSDCSCACDCLYMSKIMIRKQVSWQHINKQLLLWVENAEKLSLISSSDYRVQVSSSHNRFLDTTHGDQVTQVHVNMSRDNSRQGFPSSVEDWIPATCEKTSLTSQKRLVTYDGTRLHSHQTWCSLR